MMNGCRCTADYCFWICAVTYIPGRNCGFVSLMEAYTSSERFTSSTFCPMEMTVPLNICVPMAVDTELYGTACLHICKVFFVGSQAEHRCAFIDHFAESFSRIDVLSMFIATLTTYPLIGAFTSRSGWMPSRAVFPVPTPKSRKLCGGSILDGFSSKDNPLCFAGTSSAKPLVRQRDSFAVRIPYADISVCAWLSR